MSVNSKAFHQICDKPCANEINEMKWSPKNDLIAVLTLDGEVSRYTFPLIIFLEEIALYVISKLDLAKNH